MFGSCRCLHVICSLRCLVWCAGMRGLCWVDPIPLLPVPLPIACFPIPLLSVGAVALCCRFLLLLFPIPFQCEARPLALHPIFPLSVGVVEPCRNNSSLCCGFCREPSFHFGREDPDDVPSHLGPIRRRERLPLQNRRVPLSNYCIAPPFFLSTVLVEFRCHLVSCFQTRLAQHIF